MNSLNQKTIIVTGASRGIGRAIALEFAIPGNNILINCIKNTEKLNEVKEEIIKRGANCLTFVGDVSNFETARMMFNLAHNGFTDGGTAGNTASNLNTGAGINSDTDTNGHTDILINNAGISVVGLFQDMSRSEWDNIINVNLNSVFNCCHFAVSDMLKKHAGKIINISSVWGVEGASCEVAYSATKGAINSMTKALAKELAPSGIQVNAVACGAIDTDMNAFLNDEEKQCLMEEIPAGRLGRPEEVARFVKQLCEGNSYLTGQVICFDGGWL